MAVHPPTGFHLERLTATALTPLPPTFSRPLDALATDARGRAVRVCAKPLLRNHVGTPVPNGPRLATETVNTTLGRWLGVPLADPVVVAIPPDLARADADAGGAPREGWVFGTRWVDDGQLLDGLEHDVWEGRMTVRNREGVAAVVVLDTLRRLDDRHLISLEKKCNGVREVLENRVRIRCKARPGRT